MITIRSLSGATECINQAAEVIFISSPEGIYLVVPGILEQKFLISSVSKGATLEQAYKAAYFNRGGLDASFHYANTWYRIYPEPAMRACIQRALKLSYYDMSTGQWKPAIPGPFLCNEYFKCFTEYLNAQLAHPATTQERRMEIASGVFTPSPVEELCIKKDYLNTKDLRGAFTRCGAGDIIPSWSGAVEFISNALNKVPNASLYELIDTSYKLSAIEQPKISPTPSPTPPPKTNWMLFAGIGLALYMLFKGKERTELSGITKNKCDSFYEYIFNKLTNKEKRVLSILVEPQTPISIERETKLPIRDIKLILINLLDKGMVMFDPYKERNPDYYVWDTYEALKPEIKKCLTYKQPTLFAEINPSLLTRAIKGKGRKELSGIAEIKLTGDIMNCGIWQELETRKGDPAFRCLKYGPS